MSNTIIRPVEILSAGVKADSAKQNVSSAKNSVREVVNRLEVQIKGRNNIAGRLDSLLASLVNIETQITRIKSSVDSCATNYQKTDARVETRSRDFLTAAK